MTTRSSSLCRFRLTRHRPSHRPCRAILTCVVLQWRSWSGPRCSPRTTRSRCMGCLVKLSPPTVDGDTSRWRRSRLLSRRHVFITRTDGEPRGPLHSSRIRSRFLRRPVLNCKRTPGWIKPKATTNTVSICHRRRLYAIGLVRVRAARRCCQRLSISTLTPSACKATWANRRRRALSR